MLADTRNGGVSGTWLVYELCTDDGIFGRLKTVRLHGGDDLQVEQLLNQLHGLADDQASAMRFGFVINE